MAKNMIEQLQLPMAERLKSHLLIGHKWAMDMGFWCYFHQNNSIRLLGSHTQKQVQAESGNWTRRPGSIGQLGNLRCGPQDDDYGPRSSCCQTVVVVLACHLLWQDANWKGLGMNGAEESRYPWLRSEPLQEALGQLATATKPHWKAAQNASTNFEPDDGPRPRLAMI